MEYLELLKKIQDTDGCILDTAFDTSSFHLQYKEYCSQNLINCKDYIVYSEFLNSPWQVCHDFINTLRNNFKVKGKLFKENFSQATSIDSKCSLAYTVSSDLTVISSIFDTVNTGGAIIIENLQIDIDSLRKNFTNYSVVRNEKFYYIIKTQQVKSSNHPKRTTSVLT